MFNGFIEITRNPGTTTRNEILRASDSLEFIKIKQVDKEDVSKFVNDLESFTIKLNEGLQNLYRTEMGR